VRAYLSPPLIALAGLFLALCLAYNLALPLFEAPDERDHVAYADWLADGAGLPHMVNDRDKVGEIWQPPLYYALIAAVIAPLDRSDLETIAPLSADWQTGLSRVAHYHTAAESFPYRGAALAVHAARFVSSLLGLVTVLATYAIARLAVPGYALVAAALVALNPQFIFLSAAINNDNLVIALSSVALWLLVALASQDDREMATRREIAAFVALGLLWGLAALAKLTGLTLGLVIGLGLLAMARRRRSWRPLLLGGALVGGAALLVAGWWFWRNWRLYGDPLAWGEMLVVTAGLLRPALLSWPETLRYASFLRKSYWAMFGYGVAAPESFYWMTYILAALALAGLAKAAVSAWRDKRFRAALRERPAFWLLGVWAITVFVFLLRWMRQIDTTNQGRLLFPAIAGLTVLAAVGLAALDGRRKWLGKAAVGVLGCWAAAMPLLVIGPAFAQPRPVAPETIANPVDFRFGESIRLVGYEAPAATEPGRPLEVALYWQATAPIAESYTVATRILDAEGRPATSLDSLPFDGRYSTVAWEPGPTFRDTISLPPVSTNATPGLGSLLVILYPRGEPAAPLAITIGDTLMGNEAYVGPLKITPSAPVTDEPEQAIDASFDNRFRLLGYSNVPETMPPGGVIGMELHWQADDPDGKDYTVFVHVMNEAGEVVAQADAPPQQGRYPTAIWEAGERVIDLKSITIPPGTAPGKYTILVGLYDPATGSRLPAYRVDGSRYVDDTVPVTSIRITGR
jgi:4-amino-4-deoxy-L-arabinose transferase-like glycosyltransferase